MERTKKVVSLGMFCALAYVVMLVGRFPIGFLDFLKYDPKDVIIAIVGFIYGPLSTIVVAGIVSFIEMFTVSNTGWIGFVMNMLGSIAFASVAALIYKKGKSMLSGLIGVIAGTVCMTIVMVLWNYLITPLYMGIPREVVAGMLASVFLPFNLIKGGINAAITIILYKPVSIALIKSRIITVENKETENKAKMLGVVAFAVVALATLILCVLVKMGKI